MKNLEEIQRLRNSANSIYALFHQLIPKWNQNKGHYDKTGWGFNEDSRFNACKPASVAFSSWMGTYGDSGCGTQCRLDDTLFQKHLVKYLNENKQTVMLAIARSIEGEAKLLRSKAEAELKEQLDKLKEFDDPE